MRQHRHQRGMARLTRRITRLENEVQHAMAVMDTDTGIQTINEKLEV
jgi:hypothetical protein